MTAIEKVLLRKDAASLVVAIALGTSVSYALAGLIGPLTMQINVFTSSEFMSNNIPVGNIALQTAASFVLQIIALELLLRVVIFVRSKAYRIKKGK